MRILSHGELKVVSGGTPDWLDQIAQDQMAADMAAIFGLPSSGIPGFGGGGNPYAEEMADDLAEIDDYDQRMMDAIAWYQTEGAWWDYDSPIGNNDGDIYDEAAFIFRNAAVAIGVIHPVLGMFYDKLADDMDNYDRLYGN
ncbi:MAG: hypothetical protein GC187_03970 [Alphaproteobacteria bacterium]|nr:hypothetical protein [Alphaproteobacteria bacterium]